MDFDLSKVNVNTVALHLSLAAEEAAKGTTGTSVDDNVFNFMADYFRKQSVPNVVGASADNSQGIIEWLPLIMQVLELFKKLRK